MLSQLVNESANKGLSGLEWAVGDSGHHRRSGQRQRRSLWICHLGIGGRNNCVGGREWAMEREKYSNKGCCFEYRKSKFKYLANREIILEASLKLQKSDTEKVRGEIRNTILQRKGKIPAQPSAGCVFQNIKNGGQLVAAARQIGGRMRIEGREIRRGGNTASSRKLYRQRGGAKAEDVVRLINLCKQKVKNRFNLELEEEIIVM